MFLRIHAPEILDEIAQDLRLVTLSVGCDYFQELRAFDEVEIRTSLSHLRGNRIGLAFDYRLIRAEGALQCALGRQETGGMRALPEGWQMVPCDRPAPLQRALAPFAAG